MMLRKAISSKRSEKVEEEEGNLLEELLFMFMNYLAGFILIFVPLRAARKLFEGNCLFLSCLIIEDLKPKKRL